MNNMIKEHDSDDMIKQHENYLKNRVVYYEKALIEAKEAFEQFLKDIAKYKKFEE